jgi:hypothetical protein
MMSSEDLKNQNGSCAERHIMRMIVVINVLFSGYLFVSTAGSIR